MSYMCLALTLSFHYNIIQQADCHFNITNQIIKFGREVCLGSVNDLRNVCLCTLHTPLYSCMCTFRFQREKQ